MRPLYRLLPLIALLSAGLALPVSAAPAKPPVATAKRPAAKPAAAPAKSAANRPKAVAKAGSTSAAAQTIHVAPDAPLDVARRAWLTLSPEAARLTQWIRITSDHAGAPFAIIDKLHARLYVFDSQAILRGSAPILLGFAKGDHTVPGIGDRPLEEVQPHERTTPAGRFVAEHGENARGEHVLWLDYDAAVSMHPVLTTKPEERRLQRLASATPADNRISFGCINVPTQFFQKVVLKTLSAENPVIYVLPETRTMAEVFPGFGTSTLAAEGGASHHAAVGDEAVVALPR